MDSKPLNTFRTSVNANTKKSALSREQVLYSRWEIQNVSSYNSALKHALNMHIASLDLLPFAK